MSLGISGDRIRTISYGEERPADPRHNETAWARNRRDEFKLFK
jgi:peptidoglycan-associated lipoprotein